MKLTLEALSNIKKTCDQCTSIESLFEAEKQVELIDSITDLNACVTESLRIVEAINDASHQLKAMGYSDEWFDEVNAGVLEGLIEFNMPKFFDGPEGRAQACQEGFIDSLKTWVIKAIKFIIDLFNKIMDYMIKMARFFDSKTMTAKIKSLASELESKCSKEYVKLWFESHSIVAEGFYDSTAIRRYIDSVIVLLQAVVPTLKEPIDVNTLTATLRGDSAGINNINSYAVRKGFIESLQKAISDKGIKFNSLNDGFVLKFDPNGNKFIEFIGKSSNHPIPKKDITFSSSEELSKLVNDELVNVNAAINAMLSSNADVMFAIGQADKEYKARYVKLQKDDTTTEEQLKMCQIQIARVQCAISIIMATNAFVNECQSICKYNTQLIDAINKDISQNAKP